MRRFLLLGLAGSLMLSGCSTLSDAVDAINPFSSSGPKMAPLAAIETRQEIRTLWSYSLPKAGDFVFTPAVSGSTVFVAAPDGSVARLVDGKPSWKINAGTPLSGGVGVGAGMVTVGTVKGEVLAFSADDGKLLWRSRVTSQVLAAPAVSADGVAVRSGDNRVHLLDAADGKIKWSYGRQTPALALRNVAPPVMADRFVFAGFPGGKVVALAIGNGAAAWEGTVAQPKGATELDRVADVVTPPAIDGTQICAVAYQGKVSCFDLGQGGALIWSRDLSSAAGLALDGRYLFVTDDRGTVHALDRLSGSTLWKQDKLFNHRVTGPLVQRGMVAVGDAEGLIHFLSREDGAFVARAKTDGTPVRLPGVALGSGFVVQTAGGYVGLIEAQ